MNLNDTIIAVATPKGEGAIALLRVSGPEAISKTDYIFEAKSKQNLKRSLSPQVFFWNHFFKRRSFRRSSCYCFQRTKVIYW